MSKIIYAEDLYNKALQSLQEAGATVTKTDQSRTKREKINPLIKYLKSKGIEVRSRQQDKKNKQGEYSSY